MKDLLQIDDSLFDDLFRQYYKSLKAYAFKYVNNMDVADDIVQDVFFELWLKRDKINITTQVKSYLFKAVSNRSINVLKSNKEKFTVSIDPQHETQIQEFYLQSLVSNQEDYVLLNELNNEIKACVEKLPEQCKRIFTLRHSFNLKNKEIAEQLNISIKAVEKQITKALSEIRLHLLNMKLLPFVIYVIMRTLS